MMNESTGDNFKNLSDRKEKSPVLLRLAEKEIKENNFPKAIEILEDLMLGDKSNASAYFLLGKAYTGIANFRMALQSYKRGSELIRSEKTYRFYLKEIEYCRREIDSRENKNLSSLSSDYSGLLNNIDKDYTPVKEETSESNENIISETLAKIYLSQGQAGEAIKVYERLIRKYPLKKLYFHEKIAEINSGTK